jgi:AcrR family transcriptional regulator
VPKIVNHEEYREELIWSCFATFADHGYSRCTMKQLAAGAGVTAGTLYHYFTDKMKLFESVVVTVAETDLESLERVVGRAQGARAKLRELGDYLDRNEVYLARQNRIWCEVLQMDDNYKAGLRDLYERYRSVLRSVFEEPAFDPRAREHLTTLLASLTDGLIFHRQYDPSQSTFLQVFETFAEFVDPKKEHSP